ncbi:unnamed protein product [marine sediment metagenome]|uniref:Response regulatory domain-containing protein n=1 Tax=marine sediment metagenome TaxID=412755 RepID=X1BWR9_9ZZZZ
MILVVDDDPVLTEMLKTILEKKGHSVVLAKDGAEAYEHLRAPDCELMFLDINMPRINGAELLILMSAEGIEVPTVVMAGFRDYSAEEIEELPCVKGFLPKPFGVEEVMSVVERYGTGVE